MVMVEHRDKSTLFPIIKTFIRPGTRIISDEWKTYPSLEEEGYVHNSVNHSIEFVLSDDLSIHTQNIERSWKSLKNSIKKEGRRSDRDDLYIFKFYIYRN